MNGCGIGMACGHLWADEGTQLDWLGRAVQRRLLHESKRGLVVFNCQLVAEREGRLVKAPLKKFNQAMRMTADGSRLKRPGIALSDIKARHLHIAIIAISPAQFTGRTK